MCTKYFVYSKYTGNNATITITGTVSACWNHKPVRTICAVFHVRGELAPKGGTAAVTPGPGHEGAKVLVG